MVSLAKQYAGVIFPALLLLLLLASCRDVPVDQDTGRVIHRSTDSTAQTPCDTCQAPSAPQLKEATIYFTDNSVAGTPQQDSLKFDVKLWWAKLDTTQNKELLLRMDLQAQLPKDICYVEGLHWQGRWPKQFHLNIPEVILKPDSYILLKKNPYEGAGLRVDYELPGTSSYNSTETSLMTSWPDNTGSFTIETVQQKERIATAAIKAVFHVADTSLPSCKRELSFQLRLRFGY